MNTPKELPQHIAFVVVGASGDLAHRKIFPALFALYARGFLPQDCLFVGYARSAMDDAAFRAHLTEKLQCEELDGEACGLALGTFLKRCHYVRGRYDQAADMRALDARLKTLEAGLSFNRLFYLAIPPTVFLATCESLGAAGMAGQADVEPWTRVVMEKPFGHDRASSDELMAGAARVFAESQTYRIDHYLGKEVIQNLMALRFANTIFEPIWNRQHVEHIHILWKEDLDLAGRAGYFDSFGIVRDVMQNHLTQILALIAMECPYELTPHSVRDEKVRVLQQVVPVKPEDVVLGQYTRSTLPDGRTVPGYREDPDVPEHSQTATHAAAILHVHSPRWRGVPFLISAGKGLDARMTEIRVHFKTPDNGLFEACGARSNAFVVRVQPDEAIYLEVCNKVPGAGMKLDAARLDLRYRKAFPGRIADAYENLLLDVVRGDRSLFIRADELQAAWDIFTPVLHAADAGGIPPEPYAFGSSGPEGVRRLARRYGFDDAND
jgi:glucose-6-phosphate 1-dehydrogenase